MNKKLLLVLPLLMLMLLITACGGRDTVVATVNGEEILESELDASVDQMVSSAKQQYAQFGMDLDMESEEGQMMLVQIKTQALENLIQQEVLMQAAEEAGYTVSDEELDTEIGGIKAQFTTEEEFEEALEANGFTPESYRKRLKAELMISEFFQAQIETKEVSEEEIEAYYNDYVEQLEEHNEDAEEEEIREIREFDDIKDDIEEQLIQEDRQAQIGELIETLMAKADIEHLIDFEEDNE